MSIQIAVRLPDDLVAQLHSLVGQGAAPSRTSIVEQALRRELRRHVSAREVEVLQQESDSDLDALSWWTANHFRMTDE